MAWTFWDKRNGYGTRRNGQKLYRNPFNGNLEPNRVNTSADSYRQGWNSNRCQGNDQCGSGFACIDGQCTKVWTRDGSNYQPATCGGDDSISWAPCKKGNNNAGKKSRCAKPTPGDCEKDPKCPGEKCCRQKADGSIRCICGSCDDASIDQCDPFCDQYHKSFALVAAGCFKKGQDGFGECGGNICDECDFCDNTFGPGQCKENPNGPCWCTGCDTDHCEKCVTDPDEVNFGECEIQQENCSNCCEIINYQCSQCQRTIPGPITHCEPATSPTPCIQALREKLNRICEKDCQEEGDDDPCAPTGSYTVCEDGTPDYSAFNTFSMDQAPGGAAGCPEGKVCENAGMIQMNGQTCWFINTWDEGSIPAECEQCDCNCNNDCPDCQLCDANGTCQPDPACDVTPTFRFADNVSSLCSGNYAGLVQIGTGCDYNNGWSCTPVYARRNVGDANWTTTACVSSTSTTEAECVTGPAIEDGPLVNQADHPNPDPVPAFTPDLNDPTCNEDCNLGLTGKPLYRVTVSLGSIDGVEQTQTFESTSANPTISQSSVQIHCSGLINENCQELAEGGYGYLQIKGTSPNNIPDWSFVGYGPGLYNADVATEIISIGPVVYSAAINRWYRLVEYDTLNGPTSTTQIRSVDEWRVREWSYRIEPRVGQCATSDGTGTRPSYNISPVGSDRCNQGSSNNNAFIDSVGAGSCDGGNTWTTTSLPTVIDSTLLGYGCCDQPT